LYYGYGYGYIIIRYIYMVVCDMWIYGCIMHTHPTTPPSFNLHLIKPPPSNPHLSNHQNPPNHQDTTERLLPAYIRLTKDDIYRVRKACAEALVDLSKSVSPELRSHVLMEVGELGVVAVGWSAC
jgi:hypothetical protein